MAVRDECFHRVRTRRLSQALRQLLCGKIVASSDLHRQNISGNPVVEWIKAMSFAETTRGHIELADGSLHQPEK